MKVITRKELQNIGYDVLIFEKIDPMSKEFKALKNEMREDWRIELESVINRINNQGVAGFNFRTFEYMRGNIILDFENLSTAERLFLVAFIALKSNKKICVFEDIRELEPETEQLFFDIFSRADNIYILTMQTSDFIHFSRLLKEVG